MGCLPLLERVAGGERKAFDNLAFFVGEFRPRFHSSFVAAGASLSGVHIKSFFPGSLRYLLEIIPRVS